METIIRCWGITKQGDILGAITDEAYDWRPPSIECINKGWRYVPDGPRSPTFPIDSDNENADNTGSDSGDSSSEGDSNSGEIVTTAIGDEGYWRDWDGIDRSDLPQMAAAKLLLSARRMVDSSRWWALQWPQNAVSILSRACSLDTGKTYKLHRKLRKITVHYATERWQAVLDRRHAAEDRATRAGLMVKWVRLHKLLGRGANRQGTSMPGWTMVKRKPIYSICSQLKKWHRWRDSIMRADGQRRITSYFSRASGTGDGTSKTTPSVAIATSMTEGGLTTGAMRPLSASRQWR